MVGIDESSARLIFLFRAWFCFSNSEFLCSKCPTLTLNSLSSLKKKLDMTDWEAGLIQTAQHQIAKRQQEYNVVCTKTNKLIKPSRGGLKVEVWTNNTLHSALVGSNPAWV